MFRGDTPQFPRQRGLPPLDSPTVGQVTLIYATKGYVTTPWSRSSATSPGVKP